jgi:hypothetical protein
MVKAFRVFYEVEKIAGVHHGYRRFTRRRSGK